MFSLDNYDSRISDVHLKRGMKFRLNDDHPDVQAKKGDRVKITSIQCFGRPYEGTESDYETIRVGNGKYTWRVGRSDLVLDDFKLK